MLPEEKHHAQGIIQISDRINERRISEEKTSNVALVMHYFRLRKRRRKNEIIVVVGTFLWPDDQRCILERFPLVSKQFCDLF